MQLQRLTLTVIVICVGIQLIFSQKVDELYYRQKETMLLESYNNILSADIKLKKEKEEIFRDSLINLLQDKSSFNFPFDSLKQIGRIKSDDNKLVIFTWNIHQATFHNYYGVIQYYSKKEKKIKVYSLIDEPGKLNKNQQSLADISSWPGALYYKIITTKNSGQVYYTLLGFNFNNLLSNYKIIEIISFNDEGIPYFPKQMFIHEGKVRNRIVFEYGERVAMNLEYSKEKKHIYFDHLSPSRPSLTGQYQFYGPDLTFDGFTFEDGIWRHLSNIWP